MWDSASEAECASQTGATATCKLRKEIRYTVNLTKGCFLLAEPEKLAEGFLTAIRSLPKQDRKLVLLGLVKDRNLRRDLIDLAAIEERKSEPSRSFRDYLKDRKRPTQKRRVIT